MSGLCGILAPVVAFACLLLSVSLCPWFSWTENWLSDLGGYPGETPIWAAHGAASILLNLGLVTSGLLGAVLALGLRKSGLLASRSGRLGTMLLLLDMFAMSGIGIFPETTGGPHGLFSVVFFLLLPLSLLFTGIGLRKSNEKRLARLILLLTVMTLLAVPLFSIPRPVGKNAVAEIIPTICLGLGSIAFGLKLRSLSGRNLSER